MASDQCPDDAQGVVIEPESDEFRYLVWALVQDAARVRDLEGGQALASEFALGKGRSPADLQVSAAQWGTGCAEKSAAAKARGIRGMLWAVAAWFR